MKRILLITEPRTGSTSLMYSIGSAYNFSTQFEPDKKGKLKYTAANKGKIMQVANKLEKASKAHAGQAKTLKSLKLARGGGAAIRGTNFKGVF